MAPSLEERERIRVEQRPLPGDEAKVRHPVVDHPEQHQELRPSAVPLVHGVLMDGRVLPQPLEQGAKAVVRAEVLVTREEVPFLGVEQEEQAHHDGQESVVDVPRHRPVRRDERLDRITTAGRPRRLEPADKLVEAVEDLPGKRHAHG